MSQLLHGSTPESEFVLTTASDDDQECACEGCDNDTDDLLSLQLTCDVRGSLADYGEVGFCSMTCAMEFNREAPHEAVDDDVLIHTDNPILIEVIYTGQARFIPEGESEPVYFDNTFAAVTGHDIESMMASATEIISDTVDTHDDVIPHTFRVATHRL